MGRARFSCSMGAIGLGLVAGSRPALLEPVTARPEARAQTAPVPHHGDAADDPAVWIHPRDPGLSLVLGTDKQGGLQATTWTARSSKSSPTPRGPTTWTCSTGSSWRGERSTSPWPACRRPSSEEPGA